MALIKGKQLENTSVNLSKLFGGTAGGSPVPTGTLNLLNGLISATVGNIQINGTPGADNHAVNKAYVDSVATGLDVKKSVVAIYRPSTVASGGTPAISVQNELNGSSFVDADLFTVMTGGTPIATLMLDGVTLADGDRVLIAAEETGRQKINGIYVFEAQRLVRATDSDNQVETGEVSGGMFTFVEQGTVYGDTGWVLSFPNGSIPATGTSGLWHFDENPTGNAQIQFTQFSAAGVAEAGVGLSRVGTKFNLNYDSAIFQINISDELAIRNGGITNVMLANSTHTFAGDTGTGTVALGSTLTIAGGTNGIDTVYSAGTLTINLDLSELTTVTTIADADFIAISSSGAVNQKITFANLKTLIGAASQLNISAEGNTATSFDLDTDTLNFASGEGLNFAVSGATAPGTTNTLTLTVSNNQLSVDQITGISVGSPGTHDILLNDTACEVFSVTINGVALKKTTNWSWPHGGNQDVVRILGLPYVIETTDDIEITYRVQ